MSCLEERKTRLALSLSLPRLLQTQHRYVIRKSYGFTQRLPDNLITFLSFFSSSVFLPTENSHWEFLWINTPPLRERSIPKLFTTIQRCREVKKLEKVSLVVLMEPPHSLTLSLFAARAAAQAGAPARNENEESEVQQVPPTTVVETPSIPSPPPSAVPKPTASTEPKPPAISPGAPADPKPAANTEQKTPVISPQVSAVSKPSASTEPKPPAISPGVPADPKPAANTEQKPPVISPQVSAVPKPSASTEPKPPVIAPGASVAPKPAASSHPPPRASSAYPTPSEAARSTSISKERPASKGARSQSALGGRRRPLLSAVPDSAVLAPIRRPDNGGSAGKTISVYTNHFRVTLDAVTINQYDVDIVFVGNDGKERSARKDERWEVMQRIAKEKKDFPLVW